MLRLHCPFCGADHQSSDCERDPRRNRTPKTILDRNITVKEEPDELPTLGQQVEASYNPIGDIIFQEKVNFHAKKREKQFLRVKYYAKFAFFFEKKWKIQTGFQQKTAAQVLEILQLWANLNRARAASAPRYYLYVFSKMALHKWNLVVKDVWPALKILTQHWAQILAQNRSTWPKRAPPVTSETWRAYLTQFEIEIDNSLSFMETLQWAQVRLVLSLSILFGLRLKQVLDIQLSYITFDSESLDFSLTFPFHKTQAVGYTHRVIIIRKKQIHKLRINVYRMLLQYLDWLGISTDSLILHTTSLRWKGPLFPEVKSDLDCSIFLHPSNSVTTRKAMQLINKTAKKAKLPRIDAHSGHRTLAFFVNTLSLSPAQSKAVMQWDKNSVMPGYYCHLGQSEDFDSEATVHAQLTDISMDKVIRKALRREQILDNIRC